MSFKAPLLSTSPCTARAVPSLHAPQQTPPVTTSYILSWDIRTEALLDNTHAYAVVGSDFDGLEVQRRLASLDVQRDPQNPRVLVVRRNVTFDQHWITVEKYASWRGFIQKVYPNGGALRERRVIRWVRNELRST